ncbi:hypothetical protein [Nocardia heshunensis]
MDWRTGNVMGEGGSVKAAPGVRNSRRRIGAVLAVATLGALVAGCGSDDPPAITYGVANASAARLNLPVPAQGVLEPSQWPNGCDLLADADLTAILPQASSIDRKPIEVSFLPALGGVDPATGKLRASTPPAKVSAGGCEFNFSLPDKYGGKNSEVEVTTLAIADSASISDFAKKERAEDTHATDLGSVPSASNCWSDIADSIRCTAGRYYFEVSGYSSRVDSGKLDSSTWREKVLYEVIRTLAAKLA